VKMDGAACTRAAIESLSENLTDGFVSPVFWYAVGGLPGLIVFKVVSTMDSMVGYKTEKYLRFGWCGARTDDLMNWIPARVTWVLLAAVAWVLPGYSGRKALMVGWRQHAIVPGPNSGWSEATTAGALERRLIGPIWAGGRLVTEAWLGDAEDRPAGEPRDFHRAAILVTATGILAVAIAIGILYRSY
jgi:adenosylcobinamide-phosphate synthase